MEDHARIKACAEELIDCFSICGNYKHFPAKLNVFLNAKHSNEFVSQVLNFHHRLREVDAGFGGHHLLYEIVAKLDVNICLTAVESVVSNGGNINQQDQFGITALHAAVLRGKQVLLDRLISLGADPTIKNNKGQTPVDQAGTSLCGNKFFYSQLIAYQEMSDEQKVNYRRMLAQSFQTPLDSAQRLLNPILEQEESAANVKEIQVSDTTIVADDEEARLAEEREKAEDEQRRLAEEDRLAAALRISAKEADRARWARQQDEAQMAEEAQAEEAQVKEQTRLDELKKEAAEKARLAEEEMLTERVTRARTSHAPDAPYAAEITTNRQDEFTDHFVTMVLDSMIKGRQSQYIRSSPVLREYYLSLLQALTSGVLACQSIASGLINNASQKTSEKFAGMLNYVAGASGVIGVQLATGLLSYVLKAKNDADRQRYVGRVVARFPTIDSHKHLLQLAQELTIVNSETIVQASSDESPVSIWETAMRAVEWMQTGSNASVVETLACSHAGIIMDAWMKDESPPSEIVDYDDMTPFVELIVGESFSEDKLNAVRSGSYLAVQNKVDPSGPTAALVDQLRCQLLSRQEMLVMLTQQSSECENSANMSDQQSALQLSSMITEQRQEIDLLRAELTRVEELLSQERLQREEEVAKMTETILRLEDSLRSVCRMLAISDGPERDDEELRRTELSRDLPATGVANSVQSKAACCVIM